MIFATSHGSFDKTTTFLKFLQSNNMFAALDKYGKRGVDLLSSATPIETGRTAHSWRYEVKHLRGSHILSFHNDHEEDGVNIAIIIQYGHGTGTGGYVQGIDYINPVIRPLFDALVEDIWRQVRNG